MVGVKCDPKPQVQYNENEQKRILQVHRSGEKDKGGTHQFILGKQ